VQPGGIPGQLKAIDRWVGWRLKVQGDQWKKVPISCHTGRQAKVNDPATWASFDAAFSNAQKHPADGVGIVFVADDDFAGVDLDDCRDPVSREVQPWASEIIQRLNSYAEVSPSGTGVKVFLRGKPPGARRRKGSIEVYGEGRYFTVTGQHLAGTPTTVESRQAELEQLCMRTFSREGSGGGVRDHVAGPRDLSDEQIVARAMRAQNGERFARLWAGDTRDYPSGSEADLALARLLAFWVGPDPARVEALFGQSSLGKREKWLEREDYRRMTVTRAVQDQTTFYKPNTPVDPLLTRGTRKKQEYTGIKDTVGGGGRHGGQERAKEMAVELATSKGGLPDWQASFHLARRLRQLSADHPEQFEPAVAAFCEQAGRPFEELWYAFLHCWPKVRTAEGDDVFAWAARRAVDQPYRPSPALGTMYGAVASIAWHLAELTGEKPFWLPRERLASLLNTNAMTVSRVVSLLERHQVVRCVDAGYSYTEGKAKEYVFAGPPSSQRPQDDQGFALPRVEGLAGPDRAGPPSDTPAEDGPKSA
jgi:hypothetical protein